MKKVVAVLAVAVMSSFGSLALAAEGDAPTVKGNIEIYGRAQVSYDMIDTGAKSPADESLHKVSTNGSRLGFKGTEELGDGLNAVFQMELQLNLDGTQTTVVSGVTPSPVSSTTTGIDRITYRNTFAGLRHQAVGTLLLGIYDTPYKTSTSRLDLFVDTMGDYNAVIGNVNGTSNFDLRAKDTVVYLSPAWAGISIGLSRSTTGSETNNNSAGNANLTSASVTYDVKPLFITAAYEIHKNGYTTWDSDAYQNTGTKVGAGVAFGNTKINAVYETIKDDKSNSDKTRSAWWIGASQTFGKETIKIAYATADDGDNPATKTGATVMAVGLDHAFSKRTTVYALYAATKNEENATYGLGQGGPGGSFVPNAGEDPSVVSFGMSYLF
ncbi:MAG: porin [Nitrospirae bacterium]|nr:porin [Nitrospirota bacterium]